MHEEVTDHENESGKKFTSSHEDFSILKEYDSAEYYFEEYWTFSDEYPDEMVKGKWKISLLYENKLIAEKVFYTYENMPE